MVPNAPTGQNMINKTRILGRIISDAAVLGTGTKMSWSTYNVKCIYTAIYPVFSSIAHDIFDIAAILDWPWTCFRQ